MADLRTKLTELTRLKYADQAKWFLNGFWTEGAEPEAENIWKFAWKFIELDERKKEGNELDEFWSHKFLESLGETLTVIKLRETLRQIDVDANGKMALLEYLMFKYQKSIPDVVNAPQGSNQEELRQATLKLEAVQAALVESQQAEEAVKRSEAELRAALDDLRRQEDAFNTQISTLEQKSKDPNGTVVSKSKAAAELAQLKSENPLPLRKAKITTEAAVRKAERDRKAAEAATAAVEARFREAQEYLEQVKRGGGAAYGAMWWLDRELTEARKYMPKKRQ